MATTPPTAPQMTAQAWRSVAVFVAIAIAGAWLVASPLWFSGLGLETPGVAVILIAMMFVPTLAAIVAARVDRRDEGFFRTTTLRPSRRFSKWVGYAILAWLGTIAVAVAAIAVAAAFGWIRLDLAEFSGFAELYALPTGEGELIVPMQTLVFVQLLTLVLVPFINVIPAMGEEIGWRGFLQTRLLPLGQWPAVLITGVVWGLWHAPIVLLGYNFPGQNPFLALLLMVVFTTLVSVLLGWLTIASGTVWTAGIAHGFINGVAALPVLLLAAGSPFDNLTGTLLGYPGWIVFGLLIALLVVLRKWPVRRVA
jgi:membrane protease YdiL (CAAX protease family)